METAGLKLSVSERLPLRQAARIVMILNVVMALVGLSMVIASFVANGGTVNLMPHMPIHFFIAWVFSAFGLLILNRHPQHTVGWLIMLVGFTAAFQFLINGYMAFDKDVLIANPDTILNLAILLDHVIWPPIQILPYTLVLLYFPDGKLLSPRWRIVVISTVLGLLGMMSSGFHPDLSVWGINELNPAGIKGSEFVLERLAVVHGVLLLIGGLGSPLAVYLRFRRSTGIERMQMKWLVYAGLVGSTFIFIFYTLTLFPDIELRYDFTSLVVFLIPMTCGIAIVRHRLWDIDILINRTLVYGVLTASVVAIYVAIVSWLGILFQSQGNLLISLFATGFVAVIFQPLRDRLQRGVNRLLYGERDDPAAVLTRLAHHLETADTPTAILPNLIQTIAHVLKIPYVAIWLPAADRMKPVAVWGEASDPMHTIPLTYQNEAIGHLVVAPRGPQERFNRHEQDLLATIAALTASTVRAVQLSDELRRSRQRLVLAREEERRRLRRDLHDDLAPSLAGLALTATTIADVIPTDPAKAVKLAENLNQSIRASVGSIRQLVYDMRPPTLDELGLVAAIRERAQQFSHSEGDLRVMVNADDLPPLPAAVEVAAYRIVQEALMNVARHAHAKTCHICLQVVAGLLEIEIVDDGIGLGEAKKAGVGLQSIAERAAELGGTHQIEQPLGGGTRVFVQLPALPRNGDESA